MGTDNVKHSDYYYEFDRNDPNRKNNLGVRTDNYLSADGYSLNINGSNYNNGDYLNIGLTQDYWGEDGISLTGNPYYNNSTCPEDRIELSVFPKWKYNEDKILKELEKYLAKTYNQHYIDSSSNNSDQTLDKIKFNRREGFFAGNVTKYIDRYDTKGTPRQDLFKVLHYTILLINHLNLIETK